MDELDEKRALARDTSSTSSVKSEVKEEIDPAAVQKEADIREACKWRDAGRLRSLAETKGGLLKDELRQQACRFPEPLKLRNSF